MQVLPKGLATQAQEAVLSLPYIYSNPETDNNWQSWGFNHAVNHYDWIPAFQTKKNIIGFQQFILTPIDPNEIGMWMYIHQAAHDQANFALGTQGFNLLELDLRDPSQFAEWLRLNGDEHVRISAALGVG